GRMIEPAVRIQRMLEDGDHQHARIAGENILGSVAVVDIEIDYGDALESVCGQRVSRTDRNVVEQTEAHGAMTLRVVSGRTNGAEGVPAFAFHHEIGRQ